MGGLPDVECTLVDHGGRLLVNQQNMRRLPQDIEIFSHQGIKCILSGFEGLPESSYSNAFYNLLLDTLVGGQFQVVVAERRVTGTEDGLMAEVPLVVCTLLKDDIDVNKYLLGQMEALKLMDEDEDDDDHTPSSVEDSEFDDDTASSRDKRPEIPLVGRKGRYHVSFVAASGDVFLQCLDNACEEISQLLVASTSTTAITPQTGDLCCAQFEEDGQWYRAIAMVETKAAEASLTFSEWLVYFVDYGNTETVSIAKMKLIGGETEADNRLSVLPFQCVKVNLSGLPPIGCQWTDATADRLWTLLNDESFIDDLVVVETVDNCLEDDSGLGLDSPKQPSVRLFALRKVPNSNDLQEVCINDLLAKELDIFSPLPKEVSVSNSLVNLEIEPTISSLASSLTVDTTQSSHLPSTSSLSPLSLLPRGLLSPDLPPPSPFSLPPLNLHSLPSFTVPPPSFPVSPHSLTSPGHQTPPQLSSAFNTPPPISSAPFSSFVTPPPLQQPMIPQAMVQPPTLTPPRPITKRSLSVEAPEFVSGVSATAPASNLSVSSLGSDLSNAIAKLNVSASEFVPRSPAPEVKLTEIKPVSILKPTPTLPPFPADYASWPKAPPMPVPKARDEMSLSVLSTWNGPSRFIVADMNQRPSYAQLEADMQDFYKSPDKVTSPPPTPLERDVLYAGFFGDYQSWYRFIVKGEERMHSRPNETAVIAKLVDYGEVAVVPRHLVQPLHHQFRHLPFQAYAANLNNLKPIGDNYTWSREAMEALDEFILEKELYSLITDVTVDENFFPSINLTLELFDTSGSIDVVVTEEMIGKGFAQRRSQLAV